MGGNGTGTGTEERKERGVEGRESGNLRRGTV